MSKTSGDTARFHRLRKQKIRMRARVAELRAAIETRKADAASEPAKAKS